MAQDIIQSIAGTEDVLPDGWAHWRRLYDTARRLFHLFGYGEVRTPVLEDTRLFVKGTGETTDIVRKEMYTIPSGSDDDSSVTMRPEGTPPTIRAYLERSLHKTDPFQKYYYIGPMFRHERPQKGRLRQFHQLGVEVIASDSPRVDAETIVLADMIFRVVGLKKHRVYINSIGCKECRPAYRAELREMLHENEDELCEDCRDRVERNVLRVLDCKNPRCQDVVEGLPTMAEKLCEGCREHHEAVRGTLTQQGVAFEEDPKLVRGLDYYGRTVYEIKHPGLGARDTICGGGRYDGLVELLGGPPLPCVGFGIGAEATLIAMEDELGPPPDKAPRPDVYCVVFEDEARPMAFELAMECRRAGLCAEMDYQDRSAKAQMRTANKLDARVVFLLGSREIAGNTVAIKDMDESRQWDAPREDAVAEARAVLRDNEQE